MSFTNPQPGDKEPQDSAQPEDYARAYERGGSNDLAGERAPVDSADASDYRKIDRQLHERDAPLNQSGDPAGPNSVAAVNFSAPFIKRPIATFLLSIAVLIAGAVAYKLLPISSLPEIEFPVIAVGAQLPGADPDTMASAVATPLERQFSRIAGVNEMTSTSSTGSTTLILQFDLSRSIDGAARDVQAAINAARAQLPADMPSNPTYREINPADSPILILTLTSDVNTLGQMYDASDSILAQKLAQVEGVGQTFTGGSAKPSVRVEVNPNQLSSYGLGLDDLRAAIGTFNVIEPTGYFDDGQQRTRIATTGQLTSAASYGPLIIATDKGPVSSAQASSGLPASEASAVTAAQSTSTSTSSSSSSTTTTSSSSTDSAATSTITSAATSTATSAAVTPVTTTTPATNFADSQITTFGPANSHGIVRLEDVAKVVNGVQDIHTAGYFNDKHAILIVVFKSPGANVIATVDRCLAILPQLQASIPPTMHLQVVLDRTLTIRASIKDVEQTLIISILLVVLVVFMFLREARSTLIPSVSVPLSLMGTFGIMYLLGYTLDNLSLMALTISTGFVVDDAIVVIENIMRHLEEGLQPFDAAMKGSKEIGFTVLSMSTSLIAVFIPILMMGGIVGRLFREFAVTLASAIAVSLVVSLTTTPMLSAKFLKPHSDIHKGWFYRAGERHLARVTHEYERGLAWVLRHQGLTLGIFILTFIFNIYLFFVVPKGFFPEQDTGRLAGQLQAQQDTSFPTMNRMLDTTMKIILKNPQVQNVLGFVGAGGPGGGATDTANIYVILKDEDTRLKHGETSDKIIDELRGPTSHIPGAHLFLQSYQELRIGGRGSAAQYQYTLTTNTTAELDKWAPRLLKAVELLPQVKDVATDLQDNGLESYLTIDRDEASRLGVSELAIDSALSDAYGQRLVSTTYEPLNQYYVVMEVAQKYQQSPADIETLYVKSSTGAMVPLSQVTKLTTSRIPLAVNHQGLSPAATISFNLAPNVSLSQATVAIEQAQQQIGMPPDIHAAFAGTAEAFKKSMSSELYLVLLAIFSVYIILGILYESFIHPLTILSTLPSAGVGALLALLLFKIDLSVIAIIGIILLIGIVKKNAIMMIDFALVAEREHGKAPVDAIYEACLLRFRPIMMTTMAALLGAIPLAFSHSTGSELRRPLGVTIIGGLIVSQALTLFTTPVVYLFFDRLRTAVPQFFRWMRFELGFGPPPSVEANPAGGD